MVLIVSGHSNVMSDDHVQVLQECEMLYFLMHSFKAPAKSLVHGPRLVVVCCYSDDYGSLDPSVSEYAFILLYEGIRCLQRMCSQHPEKLDFCHNFQHDYTRNF